MATPPLTPDSAFTPTPFQSRTPSMNIDLSTIPAFREPAAPTNTLLITNLHREIFHSESLAELRALIDGIAKTIHWVPIRSFARIVAVFRDSDSAKHIRELLDNEYVMEQRIRVYYGDETPLELRDSFLHPPALTKNWLISPPGSPPVGWSQIREDPPNAHILPEDLVTALHAVTKTGRTRASSFTLLEKNEAGPGITVEDVDSVAEDKDEELHTAQEPFDIRASKVSMIHTARPPIAT